MTIDAENQIKDSSQLMESTSKSQIKYGNKSSINQNFAPVFVLSLIFGLLSLPCSSALSLSSRDASNIIKYFPHNNERIKYPFDWKKRSGAVNFSPGWGKRSAISQELVFPDEHVDKRAVNFSPGWGKRSGGSVNFSPGWGKRSGGSVNFSPGWGKRAVNFSPSWGKRNVNFSPSWGKRNTGFANFSPSWGKRSGGSVNFSPGWGKRSGGSVNFSPGWGKRSLDQINGIEDFSDTRFSHQKDINCKNCDSMQQEDSLPESLDSNNNGIPILKSDSLQDMAFLTNPTKHPLNQAYLNELRLGIHDWKRRIEDQDYDIENA